MFRAADITIHTAFYILLFAVPFLFTPVNYELFEFNKMLATYALAVIIAGAWAIKSVLSGRIIFKRTPLDIPLILFLASQVASTYFSIDRHTSIWGYYSRSHGGLLSTISYSFLYWAFVSNMGIEQVKTSIKYLLSSALIISVWGILEHFGISPSCLIVNGTPSADCWVQDVQARVFATLGQPNWLAAWLVAIAPLTWAIVISKIKSQKFWIWAGISAILFLTLLYTKSRSGLLGFLAAYVFFWVMQLKHDTTHNLVRPFLIFTFSFLILALATGTRWTPSAAELLHQTTPPPAVESTTGTTSLESGGTESGEIRKIVWKGAIDVWRHYPVFGSGVETFAYSYYNFRPVEHNQTSEWDFLYNKAHNEYLNFLSTTGVVGLGSYLFLIVMFLGWSVYKLKAQSHTTYPILHTSFFAGFISILVTNFFGFSVVNVATLFFLYPAFAFVLISNSQSTIHSSKLSTLKIIFIFPILLTTFYVLLHLTQFWTADRLYAQGAALTKNGHPAAASQALSQALNLRPNEPNYLDSMATSLSTLALDLSETKDASAAAETAQLAQEVSDRAIAISPKNLSILKSRSLTFYRLSFVDKTYFPYAVDALERATALAPTDPKVHYNLGVLYTHVGEYKKAKELFEKTLQLKPDYGDAKTALGEIYGKI